MGFKWEKDNWFWELLRFDELGLSKKFNFIVPDKITHFLMTFGLCWFLTNWFSRGIACYVGWLFMMLIWEVIWDGIYRRGASWKDMVANTVGALTAYYMLGSTIIGQLE